MPDAMIGLSSNWDVIVIGGGPAGSTTARYLAQGGVDVLVIDGRDPIGTPLQCGELVPSNAEMKRLCPAVPDIDELFQTPDNAISRTIDEMQLVPPSKKPLKFRFEGIILDRVRHDEALVELAQARGAQYLLGTRVVAVKSNTVILKDGRELSAKVIVGAGGHNDVLRTTYWQDKSLNIPVKFCLMDGDFPDAVELHFGSCAPGGYAWMIPKKEGANIGVGIQRKFAKGRSLNQYTDEFIARYQGDITFRGAGSLPMSGTIRSFVKGNHLLVGDSAGMVLPSNGAGITIAMIGGRIAGQVIVEHLATGISLHEYEKRWRKQMGKVMKNSQRSFKMGGIALRFPDWVINLGFNRFTRFFVWRAITCKRMLLLF